MSNNTKVKQDFYLDAILNAEGLKTNGSGQVLATSYSGTYLKLDATNSPLSGDLYTQSIYPNADVTKVLGDPTLRWADIQASQVTVGGALYFTDDPNDGINYGNIYWDGTTNINTPAALISINDTRSITGLARVAQVWDAAVVEHNSFADVYNGFYSASVHTYIQDGSTSTFTLFEGSPTLQTSTTNVEPGKAVMFKANLTYKINNVSVSGITGIPIMFDSSPSYWSSGASAAATIPLVYGFNSGGGLTTTTAGSAITVTDFRHFNVINASASGAGTETLTTQYGLYIANLTRGGSDYGVYIAGADTYQFFADGTTPCRMDGSLDFGTTGGRISAATGVFTLASFGNSNNEDLTINCEGVANVIQFGTGTGVTAHRWASGIAHQIGGATGISLSATSGTLTIAGIGNSNNEDLTLNFEGAANTVSVTSSTGVTNLTIPFDFKLNTVGRGFYVKEGSNACMGVATLVTGAVTVSTTKITATSRVFITVQGGTLTNVGSTYISARSVGTGFTISSTNVLDASDVAWIIIEPA